MSAGFIGSMSLVALGVATLNDAALGVSHDGRALLLQLVIGIGYPPAHQAGGVQAGGRAMCDTAQRVRPSAQTLQKVWFDDPP